MSTPDPEVKIVSEWRVSCDGGGGALGHPLIWLTIPQDMGYVICPYCDAKYVHESFAHLVE